MQSHQNSEEEEPKLPEGENLAGVRQLSPDSLADFIEWVRLRTDLDSMAEDDSAVTLMTVHASKGLEFDVVFVAGMEETLFRTRIPRKTNRAWRKSAVLPMSPLRVRERSCI